MLKVKGQMPVKVHHIPGLGLGVIVAKSCSKYLRGFKGSLRGEVGKSTGGCVHCMLRCEWV